MPQFVFSLNLLQNKISKVFLLLLILSKHTAPLFKQINYPSKYNYSLFPLDFHHTVSTSENFPLTYFIFFTIPPPPTPPVSDARSISLFASKGSLIALMIYSEYSPCVYLLSSFKIKSRFYFFLRDQNISKQRLKTLLVSFQQWRYVDSTFVFCYLTFFPSGSKYFKTKVENAISVVYAGGVWTCTDAEGISL